MALCNDPMFPKINRLGHSYRVLAESKSDLCSGRGHFKDSHNVPGSKICCSKVSKRPCLWIMPIIRRFDRSAVNGKR